MDQNEIIGSAETLCKVFSLIANVAQSETTTLIEGETGTGKELVARAIHSHSSRAKRPMVKLNCAAIPAELIESELFGHERGAFTNATKRCIGRFELAHKGTLFLDEVGEMPPELQMKLLRALQEKEIERVGGNQVIPVDVRVIAATNRDLLREVAAGRFRSDLYYRLSVFPIQLPPLRDRKQDIAPLAQHFVGIFSQKFNKSLSGISTEAIQLLEMHHWPGNVRELEHVIERSVIMEKSSLLKEIWFSTRDSLSAEKPAGVSGSIKTLDQVERDHILFTLQLCRWKVRGRGGAAELLKLPPTTLQSKMKRFGIK